VRLYNIKQKTMTKNTALFRTMFAIAMLSVMIIACKKDVSVTGVALSQTNAALSIGDTLTLTATVQPDNATKNNVTWSSSNPNVATVTNGKVTALSVGSTNIVVTTEDGNKTATCAVTVTSITLSQTIVSLVVGDTLILTATILSDNAANRYVTWESSDTAVATVINGKITTLSAGLTNIVVSTADGKNTDTCVLTVVMLNRCNVNTPNWGNSLGTVTRGGERTISGNDITQIWSDVVTATSCQKETYAGGANGNFNADCRSSPDFSGDLFSWCAVVRFQDELCPAPWRVPTKEDFINLDKAMGGSGAREQWSSGLRDNYINIWGGAYSDHCNPEGVLSTTRGGNLSWGNAFYWSQAEDYEWTDYAYFLLFDSAGNTLLPPQLPHRLYRKSFGFRLRCVRDN